MANGSSVLKAGRSVVRVGRYTYGVTPERIRVLEWGEEANLFIGHFCSIAKGLKVFLGGEHRVDWITTFPFGHVFQNELCVEKIAGHPRTKGDVVIGNDVWTGQDVTIMSGVKIGNGAVIAAGSVLTRDVGPYEVWGGNPARKLKLRFSEEIIEALLHLAWWDMPIEMIQDVYVLLSQPPTLERISEIQSRIDGRSGKKGSDSFLTPL